MTGIVMPETDLIIAPLVLPGETSLGIAFPMASARGVSHQIGPVEDGAKLYRDTSHTLRAVIRFKKYSLRLSASDISPPALGGVWVGMPVRVSCAVELYTTSGVLERPAVADSERTEPLDAGGTVTFYRPILDMRVVDWSDTFEEWAFGAAWTLDLEEI